MSRLIHMYISKHTYIHYIRCVLNIYIDIHIQYLYIYIYKYMYEYIYIYIYKSIKVNNTLKKYI